MEAVTRPSSFVHLPAWFQERFPPINFVSAFVMYEMLATAIRAAQGASLRIDLASDLVGGLALSCFFLLMRVSDEFKDFHIDSELFPDRVLQSGRIQLKHLSYVGFFAGFLMLLASFRHSATGAPWACLLNLAFAGLLNREFFCGQWLRRHIVLYCLSHMSVAITSAIWVLSMTTTGWHLPAALIPLLILPYFSGMTFEFARKSFGAEENRDLLESYSRILGVQTATACLMLSVLSTEVVFLIVANVLLTAHLGAATAISMSMMTVALFAASRYRLRPTKAGRKLNEACSGLFILINYCTILGFSLWT